MKNDFIQFIVFKISLGRPYVNLRVLKRKLLWGRGEKLQVHKGDEELKSTWCFQLVPVFSVFFSNIEVL